MENEINVNADLEKEEGIIAEIVDFDSGSDEMEVVEDYEMSSVDANRITLAIKSASTATYVLLARAHKFKAWRALNYSSWESYVRNEFDMSKQHSYHLLDLSKAIKVIEAATPDGTEIKLTEAQARDIKKQLPAITEQIREDTKDMEPKEAALKAEEIVEQARQEKRKKKEEEERKAREQEELERAADDLLKQGGKALTLSDNGSDMQEKLMKRDDPFANERAEKEPSIDPVGKAKEGSKEESRPAPAKSGEPASTPPTPRRSDALAAYSIMAMVKSVSSLPEPARAVNLIPAEDAEDAMKRLEEISSWAQQVISEWKKKK